MQSTGDYYQRAPRCCPGRNANANADALRISASVRGAELLCCCCSCSTATSTKTPGLLASLGVCVLVLGYTLLGAFAFMALEGGLKSVSNDFFNNLNPDDLIIWTILINSLPTDGYTYGNLFILILYYILYIKNNE